MRGRYCQALWEDMQDVSKWERPAPAVCVDAFLRGAGPFEGLFKRILTRIHDISYKNENKTMIKKLT